MTYHYDIALSEGTDESRVNAAVARLGGKWTQTIPRAELQLYEQIWSLPNDRGSVRYVYDHFMDVPTLRAESDEFGEPAEIIHDLSAELELLDIPHLVARTNDSSTRAFALRALAVIADALHSDIFDAFMHALQDEDGAWRDLALACIARWPQYRFAIELDRVAESEPDRERAARMRQLASDLRQHGRKGD